MEQNKHFGQNETLSRLYAAWDREPIGETLAAIGRAIQELQAIYQTDQLTSEPPVERI